MKTAQISPKPASTVDVTTVLRILKNVRNLQRSKNESQRDTERRLFYLITTMFTTNVLFCITLYVGHLSPSIAKDALLHTFVIFVAVSKRI